MWRYLRKFYETRQDAIFFLSTWSIILVSCVAFWALLISWLLSTLK